MRKYCLLLLITVFAVAAYGQTAPHYTQFMHNKLAINPAYAGGKEVMSFTALYRNQWAGIDGAPKTYSFNTHAPFFNKKCGAGLSIIGDRHGFYKTINVGLDYAYRMPMGNGSSLSIGLSGRMEYGQVDFSLMDPETMEDEDLPVNDQVRINPNFGLGAYYSHPDFYVGLSVPNIMKTTFYSDSPSVDPDYSSLRSYYLMAGYITRLSNAIQFRPSLLVTYTPNAPMAVDVNASFLILDQVWVGTSYRVGDSVDLMFQYQFSKQLKAGVAVDLTTSKLSQYSPGSFEVMLEYNLDYEGKGANHLRFF